MYVLMYETLNLNLSSNVLWIVAAEWPRNRSSRNGRMAEGQPSEYSYYWLLYLIIQYYLWVHTFYVQHVLKVKLTFQP